MDIQDAVLFYGNLKGISHHSRVPSYVKLTGKKELTPFSTLEPFTVPVKQILPIQLPIFQTSRDCDLEPPVFKLTH